MSTLVKTPSLDDGKTTYTYSPLTHMLRVYTYFVQSLFKEANPLRINFTEDEENTDIIIRMANSINAEVINKKPAVIIHRAGFTFPPMGIGGDLHNKDLRTGEVQRSAFVTGRVFFSTITKNDAHADDIAWYIVENIWALRKVEGGNLFDGSGDFQISPPSAPTGLVDGDIKQLVAVQTTMTVRLVRKTSVSPTNLRAFSKLGLTLRDEDSEDTLLTVELENDSIE